MTEFPKIEHNCTICGGSGKDDVSYHGSPIYEDCDRCKGEQNIKYYREMTTTEKLDFLLSEISNL